MEVTKFTGRANINLYRGDCNVAMAGMRAGQYDLAIVDPPYGIGYDGAKQTSGSHGGRKAHEFKGWDSKPPSKKYFDNIFRVSKNQIIWGANYFTKYLPPSMGWIIWRKNRGNFSSSDAELAFSSFNRALREYTKNPLELIREGGTIHPTQKLVCLYKWLLTNYAKQGDTILDTHGGSMSIAVACWDLGFDLDLYELDADYYAAGVERVQRHVAQMQLEI